MSSERKIVVLENILRVVMRKKEFSFENFKRELGNMAKAAECDLEELGLVLGPIFNDLVAETFDIKEKESQGGRKSPKG